MKTYINSLVEAYCDFLYEEQVKIPVEKGELGLSLDDPLEDYKKKLTGGSQKWEDMSRRLNVLYIFNKNKHPDVAKKAQDKREALAKWVEKKREENPDFAN